MNVVGVDIGGTNTKLVRLHDDSDAVTRHQIRTPRTLEDFRDALPAAIETVAPGGSIEAVGFSVAALIDGERRIVQAPNLPFIEGVDVAGPFRSRHPESVVVVENDVNCAIVGEHARGAGRGARNLCMLSLGTGVGGGVILEGELFRGAKGLAGELGHMVVQHDGPLCACGLPGHVESFLSTAAIVQRGREAIECNGERARILVEFVAREGEPEPRVLSHAADAGCPVAREVMAECGKWLGIACANLAHALQPDRILIGGGVSQADELLLGPARAEFEARLMRAIKGSVPIVQAALGVDGAAVGAAVLALRART